MLFAEELHYNKLLISDVHIFQHTGLHQRVAKSNQTSDDYPSHKQKNSSAILKHLVIGGIAPR